MLSCGLVCLQFPATATDMVNYWAMSESIEQPRKRIGEIVGEEIAAQRECEAEIAEFANADSNPQFDKRRGESNFGKRLASKIQRVIREND